MVAHHSLSYSRVCLSWLAGEDGISQGSEVTISYGAWPAEAFFLLFGFVPQPNPHDAVVLFSTLQDLLDHYYQCLKDKAAQMDERQNTAHHTEIDSDQASQNSTHDHAGRPYDTTAGSKQHTAPLHSAKASDSSNGQPEELRKHVGSDSSPSITMDQWQQVSDMVQQRAEDMIQSETANGSMQHGWQNMLVTLQGFDGRIPQAVQLIHTALSAVRGGAGSADSTANGPITGQLAPATPCISAICHSPATSESGCIAAKQSEQHQRSSWT